MVLRPRADRDLAALDDHRSGYQRCVDVDAASCSHARKPQRERSQGQLDHCIASIAFGKVGMTDRLWRLLLWPQSIDWISGKIIAPVDDDDLPVELPEKLAFGADYQSVDDELGMMMQLASLTFEDAWERATVINTPQRYLLNEFLGLHTTGQLLALAREWKLDVFDTTRSRH